MCRQVLALLIVLSSPQVFWCLYGTTSSSRLFSLLTLNGVVFCVHKRVVTFSPLFAAQITTIKRSPRHIYGQYSNESILQFKDFIHAPQ